MALVEVSQLSFQSSFVKLVLLAPHSLHELLCMAVCSFRSHLAKSRCFLVGNIEKNVPCTVQLAKISARLTGACIQRTVRAPNPDNGSSAGDHTSEFLRLFSSEVWMTRKGLPNPWSPFSASCRLTADRLAVNVSFSDGLIDALNDFLLEAGRTASLKCRKYS